MKSDVWGIFHDAILTKIEGAVPGDLTIQLQIEYLRNKFDEGGDFFNVKLSSCSKFRYSEHGNQPIEDLVEIQNKELDILYVSSENPLILDCSMGFLELEYKSMCVTLPSGREVTREDLLTASEMYWKEWKARAKNDI